LITDSDKVQYKLNSAQGSIVHSNITNMKELAHQNAMFVQCIVRIKANESFDGKDEAFDGYVAVEKSLNDKTAPWRFAGFVDVTKPYRVPTLAELVSAQKSTVAE